LIAALNGREAIQEWRQSSDPARRSGEVGTRDDVVAGLLSGAGERGKDAKWGIEARDEDLIGAGSGGGRLLEKQNQQSWVFNRQSSTVPCRSD
jgi:hypothetical protein